jgi:hypothetical protein
MDRTSGDFIAISDQDDVWCSDKVEKKVASIGNNWCSFHPSPIFETAPNFIFTDTRKRNCYLEQIIWSNIALGHTMLINRDFFLLLRKTIPNETLVFRPFFYDNILSIVSSAYGKLVYLPQALSSHRIHNENASYKKSSRRDCSTRSLSNAFFLVFRNLSPSSRKKVSPQILKRFSNVRIILEYFKDAPLISEFFAFIQKYINSSNKYICSLYFAIKNRNKIFYATEKNKVVAMLRAFLFPITIYDQFRK